MEKKRISIKDIAAEIGTSITTVSLILNGKGPERKISGDLIEKVLKLVGERNYKPNLLAQSLRTGKTNTIALLVEDISNEFFSGIARLIEEIAGKKGYKVIYSSTENDPQRTRELIDLFKARHVDGFIIAPPEESLKDILELHKTGMPLVLFDRYFPNQNISHVVVDNYNATRESLKHLVQRGYQKIAFITIYSGQTQMEGRYKAYLSVMEEAHLVPIIHWVKFSDLEKPNIFNDMMEFFKENSDLDAAFFSTNYLSIKGIEVMQYLKISIGKDMGVLSFDDIDLLRLYPVPISAIAQPKLEMAEAILDLLQTEMTVKFGERKIQKIEIPAKLTQRKSTERIQHKLK